MDLPVDEKIAKEPKKTRITRKEQHSPCLLQDLFCPSAGESPEVWPEKFFLIMDLAAGIGKGFAEPTAAVQEMWALELNMQWVFPAQTLMSSGPQNAICMALGICQDWLELGIREDTPGSSFGDSRV